MIDIHCHLLPGIDDGPSDIAASFALARALVQDNVRHVVCTPHVFPGRYDNRLSSIRLAGAEFAQQLSAEGIDLSLSFAGEVRLTPEVLSLVDSGEIPFLGTLPTGQRTMLLEMPDGQIPVGSDRFIAKLLDKGVVPVLAHPERNRAVMVDPDRLEPFVDMGCLLQLTAGSIIGLFGERVKATSRHLLDAGWVAAVASDAHNLGGRNPRMSQARAWLTTKFGSEMAKQLLLSGPARLIAQSTLESELASATLAFQETVSDTSSLP